MKTTLFKALDAADKVVVNGYELEDGLSERNGVRTLDLADETRVHVTDVEIEIDEDGDAMVFCCDTDEQGQAYNDDELASLFHFSVERPLREEDL